MPDDLSPQEHGAPEHPGPLAHGASGSPVPGAPPPGWTDTHCHLQDAYVTGERGPSSDPTASKDPGVLVAGALARAWASGVARLVCVGTGRATSAGALDLAAASCRGTFGQAVPQVFATIGLHPHDASSGTDATIELLESSLASGAAAAPGGRLVAVGECGLDYHYEHSPRDAQRRAFAEQVAAARRFRLALVIHARDAWSDLFDVLAAEGAPDRTVLHCFTGGPGDVRRCLDAGMYVSFSGIVTFKNAEEIREAARICPVDRMLVETDSPFLAPAPHRGHQNEPAYVAIVGAALAALKDKEPAEFAETTSENARAVFGL
jgi:TatD DNase family protein